MDDLFVDPIDLTSDTEQSTSDALTTDAALAAAHLGEVYEITGTVDGDVFISAGDQVTIKNATITGSVIVMSGDHLTDVKVINSQINGDIKAESLNGIGEVSLFVKGTGGGGGTAINGSISLSDSGPNSTVEIRNKVEVFGSVSMTKSDLAESGGHFIVAGNNTFQPILHGGGSANGASDVDVRKAVFLSDFEVDGTIDDAFGDGHVDLVNVDLSGDFQVQNAAGKVLINKVASTSDIAVDGAKEVVWKNDRGIGGDAGFSNIVEKVTVTGVVDLNGLLDIGSTAVAKVTDSVIKGGLEVDDVGEITVKGNEFTEGGLKLEAEIVDGVYQGEKAVIDGNLIGGGSLELINYFDVTVTNNTVSNGNLTVIGSVETTVENNDVPNGNVEVPGGSGGSSGESGILGSLNNENFPGNGELADLSFYWYHDGKIYGVNGEVQAGNDFDPGFATREQAKLDAEDNLSNEKSYETAEWNENQVTWELIQSHVVA